MNIVNHLASDHFYRFILFSSIEILYLTYIISHTPHPALFLDVFTEWDRILRRGRRAQVCPLVEAKTHKHPLNERLLNHEPN